MVDFPADCPHQTVCHCTRTTLANGCYAHEYRWILGFSSIQPSLCRSLLPTRGRNITYDFTPITDPTFDGSLPKGLGHRLRVLPTFVV
jgi:hypothetical protein